MSQTKQLKEIEIPISQCDIDDCFKPLVDDGTEFDWVFRTSDEDGEEIKIKFVVEQDELD